MYEIDYSEFTKFNWREDKNVTRNPTIFEYIARRALEIGSHLTKYFFLSLGESFFEQTQNPILIIDSEKRIEKVFFFLFFF